MKYTFNFTQQFFQGAATFIVSLLLLHFFKGEWDWGLALGVGLGSFIFSGFAPKECK